MTLETLKSLVGSGTAIHLTSPEQIKDFCKMARTLGFKMKDGVCENKAEQFLESPVYVWLFKVENDFWSQGNFCVKSVFDRSNGTFVEFSELKETKPLFEVGETVIEKANGAKYKIVSRNCLKERWYYNAVRSNNSGSIWKDAPESKFTSVSEPKEPKPQYDFQVGDTIRLNPSITERPKYFNEEGGMDYLLGGKATVKIYRIDGNEIYINKNRCRDGKDWILKKKDIELVQSREPAPQPLTPLYKVGDKAKFGTETVSITNVFIAYSTKEYHDVFHEEELKPLPKTKKVFSLEKWVEKRMKEKGARYVLDNVDIMRRVDGMTAKEVEETLPDDFRYEPELFIEVEVKE